MLVVSPATSAGELARVAADGSFSARLPAPPGSWLIVKAGRGEAPARWKLPAFGLLSEDAAAREIDLAALPGSWLTVPSRLPLRLPFRRARPFEVSGTLRRAHLDFTLRGRLEGPLRRGRTARVRATLTVFVRPEATKALEGETVGFLPLVEPLFDAAGRPRLASNYFFSTTLTPTGLPIEHIEPSPDPSERWMWSGPLRAVRPGALTAPVSFPVAIPADLPDGMYAVVLEPNSRDDEANSLPAARGGSNLFLTRGRLALPPFRLGRPARPRLAWTLLTDVPSADGGRGAIAEEDRGVFELAGRTATQPRLFVLRRLSRETGRPIRYRLEPHAPMLAQGERRLPNAPLLDLKFPSGRLSVRVRRPDGGVDELGRAPFAGGRSHTPLERSGVRLAPAGGDLTDAFQLTTGRPEFDYEFPADGEYAIEMRGFVEDRHGNSYDGGGTYRVLVGQPLDLEPAMLPTTPLQAGDAVHPGLQVLPGVPADVDVAVTHYPESDPRRARRWEVSGRANRFGFFSPQPGAPPIRLEEPGEFVVETTARWAAPDGSVWAGSSRWGSVVETPGRPLAARGRRGRDPDPVGLSQWYDDSRIGATHLRFPYASGDVLWQPQGDAAIPALAAFDREGLVTESILGWAAGGRYAASVLKDRRAELSQRVAMSELPLSFSAPRRTSPALYPDESTVRGYWYAGVQRPGERVRELLSDDQGAETAYWRFNEAYGMQPGVSLEGEAHGDFKFLYGGVVYRDLERRLARYGIYGALWTMTAPADVRGPRVYPPFRGRHGGPDGGPLLALGGRELDAFAVPLSARPGTVLETGDALSFSASLAPAMGARVRVAIEAPDGSTRAIEGRANSIGWFYEPGADLVASLPGVWKVRATAYFDEPTSAGTVSPPPEGAVLGADDGYEVYVAERGSEPLSTSLPAWSAVRGADPAAFPVSAPGARSLRYTIAMPGYQLRSGTAAFAGGEAAVVYDAAELSEAFPHIDWRRGRGKAAPGLADTVWVSVLADGPSPRARHFTLQGPDLHAPGPAAAPAPAAAAPAPPAAAREGAP